LKQDRWIIQRTLRLFFILAEFPSVYAALYAALRFGHC
jgi:hypothetical protein